MLGESTKAKKSSAIVQLNVTKSYGDSEDVNERYPVKHSTFLLWRANTMSWQSAFFLPKSTIKQKNKKQRKIQYVQTGYNLKLNVQCEGCKKGGRTSSQF